jgi:hypothetical protein
MLLSPLHQFYLNPAPVLNAPHFKYKQAGFFASKVRSAMDNAPGRVLIQSFPFSQ